MEIDRPHRAPTGAVRRPLVGGDRLGALRWATTSVIIVIGVGAAFLADDPSLRVAIVVGLIMALGLWTISELILRSGRGRSR